MLIARSMDLLDLLIKVFMINSYLKSSRNLLIKLTMLRQILLQEDKQLPISFKESLDFIKKRDKN